ncbi:hypothetical protein HLBENOHH_02458 [Aeromonas dhakensis]|uniref:PAAR domain-containing protein n=1 Tax=Aeromonas dhakensis TaxID=196024 RepID=UPI00366CB394
MPRVIGLGDKTTTGGDVIECYPDVQLNNQGTTVIGMKATCPACKVGIGSIMPMKAIKVVINNIQVAIEGDWVQCGCPPKSNVLIGNPGSYVVADDQGSVSMKMPFLSQEHAEQTYQTFSEVASGNKSIAELFATVANTDDWKPVPGYRGVIYHTKNQMDDYEADDLKHGDYTAAEIMSLGQIYNFALNAQELAYPASVHFFEFRAASKFVSSLGEYGSVIDDLIDRFESGSGEKYSSDLLTKAMKEHRTTKLFHAEIDKEIKRLLSQFDSMPSITRESVTQRVNTTVSLPKFDDRRDRFNGLGIAVHDIFAAKVELTELEFKDRQYRGKLSYQIQDHFGLDELDVNGGKGFEFFTAFRSWFLLQRYKGYDYKPFITEMVFDIPIEGTF